SPRSRACHAEAYGRQVAIGVHRWIYLEGGPRVRTRVDQIVAFCGVALSGEGICPNYGACTWGSGCAGVEAKRRTTFRLRSGRGNQRSENEEGTNCFFHG